MRRYETTFISHPDLPQESLDNLTQRTTDAIKSQSGEIIRVQQWGKKRLAYKLKRHEWGFYTLLDYAASAAAVRELERILRLDDKVMKFLTVKLSDQVDLEALRKAMEEAPAAAATSTEEEASISADEQRVSQAEESDEEESPSESDEESAEELET